MTSNSKKLEGLADRIKTKRITLNLSRPKTANVLGVAISTLQAWEDPESKREPSASDLVALSKLLNEPVECILLGSSKPENNNLSELKTALHESQITKNERELLQQFELASFKVKAEVMALLSTGEILNSDKKESNSIQQVQHLDANSERKPTPHHTIMAKEFLNLPDDVQREILQSVNLQKSGQNIEYKKKHKEN